jgi:hypothetical protein
MKKQKTHALIIVMLITIILWGGNLAAQPNIFPTTGFTGIGTTTPVVNLEVRGDVKFIDPVSLEEISFARPWGENGFNLTSSLVPGSSAHFKFDGSTLRILTKPTPGGPPLNTAGIAIDKTFGWVGLGTTSPQGRLHISDNSGTDYGTYINTNSNGPSLIVNRENSGSVTLPTYTEVNTYGCQILNTSNNSNIKTYSGLFRSTGSYNVEGIGIESQTFGLNQTYNYNKSSHAFIGLATNALTSYGGKFDAHGSTNAYGVNCSGNYDPQSITYADEYAGVKAWGYGVSCKTNTFGVWGRAQGGRSVIGIYGDVNAFDPECETASIWAGFFNGNVNVIGALFEASDIKLKENVKPFTQALAIINKLETKTYEFKKSSEFEGMNLPEGTRYGLIAQELEKILPNLVRNTIKPEVKDDKNNIISKEVSYKSVNYTSLIPILVEGIKEQQTQIEELKNQLKNNSNGSKPNNNGTANDLSEAILYQNSPNPFSENTTIKYHLANIGDAASIMVFDMNGKLLKAYELNTQNVDGDVQISSGTLMAGMYYYSLVVKGKEISTLKMILAK